MLEFKENKNNPCIKNLKQEAAVVELFVYSSARRPATTGKTGEIQDQEAAGAGSRSKH